MPTIASLVTRCQQYLQDEAQQAWTTTVVQNQLCEEVQRLARQELFGVVTWVHGVAGQAIYTLTDTTVGFEEVIYDGRSLRHVADDALTRLRRDWEGVAGTPAYWTDVLQAPNALRLVPQPLATGLSTATTYPVAGPVEDNLVVFRWRMPQAAGDTTLQLLDVLMDAVVYRTVAVLCGNPGEWQDLAKAAVFQTLGDLIVHTLLGAL